MEKLRRFSSIFLPVLLAILIGCGGGGANPRSAPNALSRDRVHSGLALSLLGLAQGGFGGVAGTTGGTTGGSGGAVGPRVGVPFIGAFIRNSMGNSAPAVRARRAREAATSGGGTGTTGTTGTTGSGTGGDVPPPSFYFDDYLGLWTDWTWSESSSLTDLFEDEGKSKPAGQFRTTYAPNGDYLSTFTITAGPFKGAYGRYQTVITGPDYSAGSTDYDNTWPGLGHDVGGGTWSPDGGTWNQRSDLPDGSWYEYHGTYQTAGGGSSSGADSFGYRYSFRYLPDGSGEGKVEGPEAGLPCTITWRADGWTRIVWSDGTVEEFGPEDWYGGTTGSGSSGGDGGTEPGGTTGPDSGTTGASSTSTSG